MPTKDAENLSRLRGLSDEELLRREFDAADPETLDGITTTPRSDATPIIEYAYDLKTRGRKARCVYCKWHNHYVGVVVAYPSGERALVGRDCAVQHHGADFGVLLNDFDAARERQAYLRRKNAVLSKRHDLHREMADLIAHPAVQMFGHVRREWRDLMGSMFPALVMAAQNGALRFEREVVDQEAEAKRAAKLTGLSKSERRLARRRGDLDPVIKRVVEDLGQVSGAPFFYADDSVVTKLKSVDAEIRGALFRLSAEELTTRQMRGDLILLADCAGRIGAELDRLKLLPMAFEVVNLSRIAEWANGRAEVERPEDAPLPHHSPTLRYRPASRPVTRFGRFHASDRAFHRTDGESTWTVALPPWFSVPQAAVRETLNWVLATS